MIIILLNNVFNSYITNISNLTITSNDIENNIINNINFSIHG